MNDYRLQDDIAEYKAKVDNIKDRISYLQNELKSAKTIKERADLERRIYLLNGMLMNSTATLIILLNKQEREKLNSNGEKTNERNIIQR